MVRETLLRRAGLALLPLALASGCAIPGGQHQADTALLLPASYSRDNGLHTHVSADTAWRDYFTDPQLQTLIEQALARNRDLRSAVLQVQEAQALYGIQRAELAPAVGLAADGSRGRTPADLSPSRTAVIGSQYSVGLGVASWEIDFWGRIRHLEQAALQNYLATDAAQRALRTSLVAELAHAWLLQREYDQRIAIARASVASRQESTRIYTRRYRVGASSRLELTQVQTLLTQAQALLEQLEQARERNGHALALLAGGPVDLTPQAGLPDRLPPLQAALPSSLLTARPDIVAAEHQLAAANARIGAARAAFFPSISLTGMFGTASSELDGLFQGGSRSWSFMPSLSLPIFTAGRLRNNLNLAEVRADMAVARYEKTVQSAFRDVADALSARHWLERQLATQQQGLQVQRERTRLVRMRYDSGAISYLEVLDAERSLLQAEQDWVVTRRQLLATHITLFAALGGGALGSTPAPLP